MNPDISESPPQQGPQTRPGRKWRLVLYGVGCLFALVLLAVAVENWRGKRAWERYRSELEAQGEQLDFEAFVTRPVPPEKNFCEAPFFATARRAQSALEVKRPEESGERANDLYFDLGMGEERREPPRASFHKGTFVDLEAWREFYHGNTNYPQADESLSDAEAVLVALSKYDAAIAELREAARKPHSVLSVDYQDPVRLVYEDHLQPLFPLLAECKKVTLFFSFHASALLDAGRADDALEDIDVCLRIAEALGNDPLLISELVRIAVIQIMMQPVWEGLAKHGWDEPQLAKLQDRLAAIDFLASFRECMRAERAWGNALLWAYRDSNPEQPAETESDAQQNPTTQSSLASRRPLSVKHSKNQERAADRLMTSTPKGWLYQNQVACNRLFQEAVLPVISLDEHRIYLDRQRELERWPEERGGGLYTVLARMLAPAISKASFKFARSQALVDLATVACALERYRLAEGAYPERLKALTPRFLDKLPPDVINGEPLKYRRETDGGFVLYSIGLNEMDDDGVIGLSERGTVHADKGDWVWRYPEEEDSPK